MSDKEIYNKTINDFNDTMRRVNERLDAINLHISGLRKDLDAHGELALRLEDAIGGNKLNNNEGLYHKFEALSETTQELKEQMTLFNERMDNYKSGYTWGSRLTISSIVAFVIWYFTKK